MGYEITGIRPRSIIINNKLGNSNLLNVEAQFMDKGKELIL